MLAVSVNVNVVGNDERGDFDAWFDALRAAEKSGGAAKAGVGKTDMRFVRLEGTSASGPCSECAQYFFVEHDGSGTDVPVIPLHPNCVCRDVPLDLLKAAEGDAAEPMAKGEWIERRADPKERAKILGVGKAKLLDTGAVTLAQLYERQDGPLSKPKPLRRVAAALVRAKSKAALIRAAAALGLEVKPKATRAELVNLILGRETV